MAIKKASLAIQAQIDQLKGLLSEDPTPGNYEEMTNRTEQIKKLSDELSASLLEASRECSKSKTGTTMVEAVLEAYINKKG